MDSARKGVPVRDSSTQLYATSEINIAPVKKAPGFGLNAAVEHLFE